MVQKQENKFSFEKKDAEQNLYYQHNLTNGSLLLGTSESLLTQNLPL